MERLITNAMRNDATDVLRRFARRCALDVLHLWDAPDVVRKYLETGDESFRAPARAAAGVDDDIAAVGEEARAAVGAASRDATWAAPDAVARDAAWKATWAAPDAAARKAARAKYTRWLDKMLR